MTASEVIQLAATRGLSVNHIKDTDIAISKKLYVTSYIEDTIDEDSTFFETYCKPVIAYGVIVQIWNRIATELTDRGTVQMAIQGAVQSAEASNKALKEYSRTLSRLIDIMQEAAIDEGFEVVGDYYSEVMMSDEAQEERL